jgi:hypothetical protein
VEQDLGAEGAEAGRLDHPQGGGVARGDLGEQRLAGRDQVAGAGHQQPPQAAVAAGRVDLEGDLPAAGQAPSQHQHPGAVLVGPYPQVAPVAGGSGGPRVPVRVGHRPQGQRRVPAQPRGGQDHVQAARMAAQPLPEPAQEPRAHRRPQVPLGQPRGHQVGVDPGRHHIVGGERQHRIHRPVRPRPHLHHPVGRRQHPAGRVLEQPQQPITHRPSLPPLRPPAPVDSPSTTSRRRLPSPSGAPAARAEAPGRPARGRNVGLRLQAVRRSSGGRTGTVRV